MNAWAIRLFVSSAAVLGTVVAIFSYRYLVGIGPLASSVMHNLFQRPWLDVHIAGAATALLVVPAQFLARLRPTGLHRYLGRVYVLGCVVGGVGGLILAAGTTAGPIATIGFGGLALLWLLTTLVGWRAGAGRRFETHRRWMIRSFSLTLAAVTLRLYLPILHPMHVDMLAGYRAISFLCWVPNLLLAELYLARGRRREPAFAGLPARPAG